MTALDRATCFLVLVTVSLTSAIAAANDLRVVKPASGRDVVRPMRPDWCAAYKGDDESGCDKNCQARTLDSFVSNVGSDTEEADLPGIAAIACDFPNNPAVQQQVAYLRQSWINRTGISERDDRAALRLYVAHALKGDPDIDDAVKAECVRLQPTAPQDSATEHRQELIAAALCNRDPISIDNDAKPGFNDLLVLDRPDTPTSMIISAYFVFHSFEEYDTSSDFFADRRSRAEKIFPLANVVLANMDPGKLDAEIRALGLTGIVAYRAKALFGAARVRAQPWGDYIRNDAKTDLDLAKVIAAAKASFDGWGSVYKDHQAAFDLAFGVEDRVVALPFLQRQKPNAIGCEPLRAALLKYASSAKPLDAKSVHAALTDAVGYPLLSRLVVCDAAEGRWGDAAAERAVLQSGRFAGGPFAAAVWGVIDAGGQFYDDVVLKDAATDIADHIIDAHVQNVSTLNEIYDSTGGVSEEDYRRQGRMIEQGRVAKVKKTGSAIMATFSPVTWYEPTYECTNTGRIGQFESDGTPVYIRNCTITGSHRESFQLEPHVFTDRSAAGLAAGQLVKLVTSELQVADQSPATPSSFVLEVDRPGRGKAPPVPLRYFGIKLK